MTVIALVIVRCRYARHKIMIGDLGYRDHMVPGFSRIVQIRSGVSLRGCGIVRSDMLLDAVRMCFAAVGDAMRERRGRDEKSPHGCEQSSDEACGRSTDHAANASTLNSPGSSHSELRILDVSHPAPSARM